MHEVKKQNSYSVDRQQRGSVKELHASVDGLLCMKGEIWKDVIGYKGIYEVSNFGRLRNFDNFLPGRKRIILKQRINEKGYLKCSLYKKNKLFTTGVARVIARAFIPNPKNLPVINHLDSNKLNNSISNLEWTTVAGNNKYAVAQGRSLKGEKNKNSYLTEKEVKEIRKLRNKIGRRELAKKYKTSEDNIYAIITRITWKHI